MHERIRKILDESSTTYKVHLHQEQSVPIYNPQDFAHALGYEIDRITKTLFLQATEAATLCLVVVSSNQRINFNKVADVMNCKRVQISNQQTLAQKLAYPPTGVSPIGAGSIPILMDEYLMHFPTILIGAGEVAKEIEIAPQSLRYITNAIVTPLVA